MSDTTPPEGDPTPPDGEPAPPTPPPPPPTPSPPTPPPGGPTSPPPPGGFTPPPPPGGFAPAPSGPAGPPPSFAPPPPGYPPATPYVPAPPGGPPKPTNGLAIAALVLGIIAVLCFGLGALAGIAAIVLGALGMKKAAETGSGKGMAIAGLVLGIIGVLLWIAVIVAIIVADDDESSSDLTAGTADSSDYELTTPPDACKIDRFGFVTFAGTIENTAGRGMNFVITGEIRSSDTKDLLAESTKFVEVAEDDTEPWELTTLVDPPEDITCKVTGVDNFFN
ncbi:MAG TPA: DUF4190 domain-containing protein [Acidimicrobiales bacterium]